MSATEELRRMLDERGVKWEADDTQLDESGTMYRATYVKEGYGRTWVYEEPPDCALLVSYAYDLGAEQAIEATLGRGTCYNTDPVPLCWSLTCSECGVHSITEGRRFNYCPNCGAKVVE